MNRVHNNAIHMFGAVGCGYCIGEGSFLLAFIIFLDLWWNNYYRINQGWDVL